VSQQQIPTGYEVCDASKDDDTDTRRHYQIERGTERCALSFFLLDADSMKCACRFFAERWCAFRVSGRPGGSLKRNCLRERLNILCIRGSAAKDLAY
jgi:hypothetical protein